MVLEIIVLKVNIASTGEFIFKTKLGMGDNIITFLLTTESYHSILIIFIYSK
jgi:hypothetical protein